MQEEESGEYDYFFLTMCFSDKMESAQESEINAPTDVEGVVPPFDEARFKSYHAKCVEIAKKGMNNYNM